MTEDDDVLNKTITAVGTAVGVGTASATMRVRTSYAMSHVASAKRFHRMLVDLESRHVGAGWGDHWAEAKDYATAALILSFSAVEAAINEALDDLDVSGALYDVIEKAATIAKAEALLIHLGAPAMPRGENPTQALNLLREVRNFLVHARGEWSDVEGDATKLSKKIAGAGFQLSPFDSDPRWAAERGVMSASAAEWAVNSAWAFICEFRSRAGLKALPLPL